MSEKNSKEVSEYSLRQLATMLGLEHYDEFRQGSDSAACIVPWSGLFRVAFGLLMGGECGVRMMVCSTFLMFFYSIHERGCFFVIVGTLFFSA